MATAMVEPSSLVEHGPPMDLPVHFLKNRVQLDTRRATIMPGASPRTGLRGLRVERSRRLETRRGTLLGAVIKFEAEQV